MSDIVPLFQQIRAQNERLWKEEFAAGVSVLNSHPSWFMLDTGSICNLRCVQCPRENPSISFIERHGSPDVAEQILSGSSYLSRLTLFGLGEPLLSDLFWKIVEDDRCKGIDIDNTSKQCPKI